ncbi:hypothetical protein A6R68_11942, partial [Neotoma lepida]
KTETNRILKIPTHHLQVVKAVNNWGEKGAAFGPESCGEPQRCSFPESSPKLRLQCELARKAAARPPEKPRQKRKALRVVGGDCRET